MPDGSDGCYAAPRGLRTGPGVLKRWVLENPGTDQTRVPKHEIRRDGATGACAEHHRRLESKRVDNACGIVGLFRYGARFQPRGGSLRELIRHGHPRADTDNRPSSRPSGARDQGARTRARVSTRACWPFPSAASSLPFSNQDTANTTMRSVSRTRSGLQ